MPLELPGQSLASSVGADAVSALLPKIHVFATERAYNRIMRPMQSQSAGTPKKIIGFHMDENRDWLAELECGHQQYVRHNPPWREHHWVTTAQGRLEHMGQQLPCSACRLTPSR
jgi:Protein of unknown function (DUF3565)